MRKETYEYNYDQMLCNVMSLGSKIFTATEKEIKAALPLIPNSAEGFGALAAMGEVGGIVLKHMGQYFNNLMTAHEMGKKVVLSTFCYPVGIFYAFKCVPINIEVLTGFGSMMWKRGVAEFYDHASEVGMTETSCAAQRGAIGAYLAGLGTPPDFSLINTAGMCDSNATAFQFYTAYKDIPIYIHDQPPALIEERSREYMRKDFREMLKFMEEQTGQKLDVDYFKQVAEEMVIQDELIGEVQTMVAHKPMPYPNIVPVMSYMVKFLFNGMPEGTEILKAMVKLGKDNLAKGIAGTTSGVEKARVLPCYIEHLSSQMAYFIYLDSLDISTVGSLLGLYWNSEAPYAVDRQEETYKIDPTNIDTILDTMADQLARMPMIKQIRGPYNAPNMWLEDTLSGAKAYKADAIVYIATMGCRNTWGAVKMLARDCEKAGYPFYILYADSFDDRVMSWDACKNRLEEFFRVRKII